MQANNPKKPILQPSAPSITNSNVQPVSSDIQGSKFIQEDPQIVAKKGLKAVKVLADNVGDMFRQKLIKEGRLQDANINTVQTQGDRSLKQLAELIAEKFRFGRLPNQITNQNIPATSIDVDARRRRVEHEE